MRERAFEVGIRCIGAHYGVRHQLRKLQEELKELSDAIDEHLYFGRKVTKDHVAEEMADCFVLGLQLMGLMAITPFKILYIAAFKVKRQIWRINTDKEAKEYAVQREKDILQWFLDKGITDGLHGKRMMDKNEEAEFPSDNCRVAYRRGYRLGEGARKSHDKAQPD